MSQSGLCVCCNKTLEDHRFIMCAFSTENQLILRENYCSSECVVAGDLMMVLDPQEWTIQRKVLACYFSVNRISFVRWLEMVNGVCKAVVEIPIYNETQRREFTFSPYQ